MYEKLIMLDLPLEQNCTAGSKESELICAKFSIQGTFSKDVSAWAGETCIFVFHYLLSVCKNPN